MRIVKYILLDGLSIFLFTVFFLFNPDSHGNANILVAMVIGVSALCAEFLLILYYLITAYFDNYNGRVHTILFSVLCLCINVIAVLLGIDDVVISIYFYGAIFGFSILVIVVYNKIITAINRSE